MTSRGIVAKRLDDPYDPRVRWLKIKNPLFPRTRGETTCSIGHGHSRVWQANARNQTLGTFSERRLTQSLVPLNGFGRRGPKAINPLPVAAGRLSGGKLHDEAFQQQFTATETSSIPRPSEAVIRGGLVPDKRPARIGHLCRPVGLNCSIIHQYGG
jgi:hypothetical protein